MSTFDSTKTRLAELLRDIEAGKIQLPDFQRGWVWDDEHIRSLLVSIARAFPVGAIMLLENGGEAKFKMRPVEGLDPAKYPPQKVEKLILDGQQRLTSLTQVLVLNQAVTTRDEKKRPIERFYYIDIEKALLGPEHYEDAIIGVGADKTLRTNFGKDITLDLRNLGVPWTLHCWMHTLATAHEHSLENVIDQLLQDFLQVWGPDDYSTQFVDECLPIIFNIFRYSKVYLNT